VFRHTHYLLTTESTETTEIFLLLLLLLRVLCGSGVFSGGAHHLLTTESTEATEINFAYIFKRYPVYSGKLSRNRLRRIA
jgi:hypothetical protein